MDENHSVIQYANLRDMVTKGGVLRFSFYLVTAVMLTWPLVLHLPTHLPLGTETAATVPLFNLWTLIWNVQALTQGYAGYWNAPIFYPEAGTFGLSDPQPLTGMIFAVPYFLSHNPVFAYNVVFLLFLMLNGWAASSPAFLASKQEGEKGGWLVGLFAQSLPFVTREWGVLQLVAVFPVMFALRAVVRFGRQPSLREGLALGGWVAVTFLTSSYYGLFLVLVLPLGSVLARQEHFHWRNLLNLFAGAALAGVLLWPVLSAQMQAGAGYSRSESTIQKNSA
ncbi:MAG: hypothetical protein Fur0022_43180 [Anaerolineales bacterium]